MKLEGPAWRPSPALLGAFVFLCVVLGLRSFRGLDLSDEMQYYGQMAALARNGSLFSTDLFIQQLVYLPLYPLLKGHWLLFGDQGLVLAGRACLSLALLGQFFYVQHWFRRRGAATGHALLVALTLSFAATYHGIYAISYNSASQIAWVIFCLWFMDPRAISPWRWALLLVLTGFAHPAAALAMGALLAGRLWLMPWPKVLVAWLGWSLALGILAVWATLSFTSVAALQESLRFSRDFAVGNALWAQPSEWVPAMLYAALLMLTGWGKLPAAFMGMGRWVALLVALALVYGIRYLLVKHLAYGYTAQLTQMGLCLVGLCGVWLRLSETACAPAGESTAGVSTLALRLALSVQFLVLVVTSSNGLAQGLGGIAVAVPMLLGVVSLKSDGRWQRGLAGVLALTLLLCTVHWSTCPYRDLRWYQLDGEASGIRALKHLTVSAGTEKLLRASRVALSPEVAGTSTWIASELPVLYFALDVQPSACMLYMHSTGGSTSSSLLQACMLARKPAVIVDLSPGDALNQGQDSVRNLVNFMVQQAAMNCRAGRLLLDDKVSRSRFGPSPMNFRVCQLGAGPR